MNNIDTSAEAVDRSRDLLRRYWSGAWDLSDDLATELASVLAERDRLAEAVTHAVAWADRHGKEPDWLDEARAALAGEGRGDG